MMSISFQPNAVFVQRGVNQAKGLRFGKEVQVFRSAVCSTQKTDIQQMAQLVADLRNKSPKTIQTELEKILAGSNTTLAVIHNDKNELAAVGLFEPDHLIVSTVPSKRYGLISDIYITKQAQGKRLGEQVLQKLCEYARQKGFTKLLVEANSPQVYQLAKDMGFDPLVPQALEETYPIYLLQSLDGKPVSDDEQHAMQLRIGVLADMRRFIYQPRDRCTALLQRCLHQVRHTIQRVKNLENLFDASF